MDESITADNKKQNRQKPPRSFPRITCEIMAGALVGLAITMPIVYVLVADSGGDCFEIGRLIVAIAGLLIVPPVYAIGTVVGVYLVGSRGKQTGSFLLTLGGGLVGGLGMFALLPFAFYLLVDATNIKNLGLIVQSVVLLAFVFLLPPIMATLGINWRRTYKEPPSS